MMHRTCDICGKEICKATYGRIANTIREESCGRNTMRIASRSKYGVATNFDDVCGECTDGILDYIASRKKEGHK